jgi:hypothetical protein
MIDNDDQVPNLDEFDLEDFNEQSPWEMGDEDLFVSEESDEGGISRTFKIVFGVMLVVVVGIVIVLIAFALTSGNDISAGDQTRTAVIQTNTAVAVALNETGTAVEIANTATQSFIQTQEFFATQTEIAIQTVQAQQTIDAANTATQEFIATQTAAAEQTATQQALNEAATATAQALILKGRVVAENNTAFGNVQLRLYRDDGDSAFDPAEVAAAPTPAPGTPQEPGAGEPGTTEPGGEEPSDVTETGDQGGGDTLFANAKPIAYGETLQGTIPEGDVDSWTFTGTAGDIVTIRANASDIEQMDMFLELYGPDEEFLIEDDDSGGDFNAAIIDFTLPLDGQYLIQVDSVAAPGNYTLSLTLGAAPAPPADQPEVPPAEEVVPPSDEEAPPADDTLDGLLPTEETSYVLPPFARVVPRDGLAGRFQDDTPTPEPGDQLISTITTGPNGSFDFGVLEPGDYWLEIDYDSLPPDLQALVPAPTEGPVLLLVSVPTEGEVTFIVFPGPSPTPSPVTPGLSPEDMTGTAEALTTTPGEVVIVLTITPSPEMPESGLFSSDEDGNIDSASGLTILAIAAAGLVAVVFIARKLRTSA